MDGNRELQFMVLSFHFFICKIYKFIHRCHFLWQLHLQVNHVAMGPRESKLCFPLILSIVEEKGNRRAQHKSYIKKGKSNLVFPSLILVNLFVSPEISID